MRITAGIHAISLRKLRVFKYATPEKDGDGLLGPEAEFFIFDNVRYESTSNSGYYFIDSDEGIWNGRQDGLNLGNKPRTRKAFPRGADGHATGYSQRNDY